MDEAEGEVAAAPGEGDALADGDADGGVLAALGAEADGAGDGAAGVGGEGALVVGADADDGVGEVRAGVAGGEVELAGGEERGAELVALGDVEEVAVGRGGEPVADLEGEEARGEADVPVGGRISLTFRLIIKWL